MMGVESFAALDKWHRGFELPQLACLVIVPREDSDIELFHQSIGKFWSGLRTPPQVDPRHHKEVVELNDGGKCIYLQTPRLDISSTVIRQKWKEGKSLAGLVPQDELGVMLKHTDTISSCWTIT